MGVSVGQVVWLGGRGGVGHQVIGFTLKDGQAKLHFTTPVTACCLEIAQKKREAKKFTFFSSS